LRISSSTAPPRRRYRLEALVLDVLQALLGPAARQLARRLGLLTREEDAERHQLAAAAVDELVRHESRLRGDPVGEIVVDAARELGDRLRLQAIAPHAREHLNLLRPRPTLLLARGRAS
jgi:hypothetical protein